MPTTLGGKKVQACWPGPGELEPATFDSILGLHNHLRVVCVYLGTVSLLLNVKRSVMFMVLFRPGPHVRIPWTS